MKIFLSYSSAYRAIADDICCRLQAVGHEVFFDREDLPAGISFDDHIRHAIEESELFIFLVTPEAVENGRYTRTELKLASRKWPNPDWHVLPVLVAATPFADIPAYLRSLTLLQPEGNLPAEVVFEVEDRVRAHRPQAAQNPLGPSAPAIPASSTTDISYRSLQLDFSDGPAGQFLLSMPDLPAPLGDTTCAIDPNLLEQSLWTSPQQVQGSARRGNPDATATLPSAAAVRQVGQAMYEALFASSLGPHLQASLRGIDPQRSSGLRFVINTRRSPQLARLPWEFLYSAQTDDFLFSDRMKPLVRWLDEDRPPPALLVTPPLKLLIAIATPTDRAELEVGEELARLDEALGDIVAEGTVEIRTLHHASIESLDNALLRERPHVLHFIGHGDFSDGQGYLVLESDAVAGRSESIASRQLAVLLRNHRTSLRLVFLNSCMGSSSSRQDIFGGIAQNLVRRGIPAVIAMQFPIPDSAAVLLARHFYRYLAAGQAVDAALASTRAFLFARGHEVEWGAPTLYMSAPDGRLFDLVAAVKSAVTAPPVPVPMPAAPPPRSDELAAAPVARSTIRLPLVATVAGLMTLLAGALWIFSTSIEIEIDRVTETIPATAETVADLPEPAPPAPLEHETSPILSPPAPLPEARPAGEGSAAAQLPGAHEAEQGSVAGTAVMALADSLSHPQQTPLAVLQQLNALDSDTLHSIRPEEILNALQQRQDQALLTGQTELASKFESLQIQLLSLGDATRSGLADDKGSVPDAGSDFENVRGWWSGAGADVQFAMQVEPAAGSTVEPFTYPVRKGDTLWSIARRLSGKGENWRELLEFHNASVQLGRAGEFIENSDRIEPGLKLHLKSSSAAGLEQWRYHVQPGDSLSAIAARIYGESEAWPQIYQLNTAVIRDPNIIHPGQVLEIQPLHY